MSNRRVPFASDIHHLLGSTLRDPRKDRLGHVVGLDQRRARPVIDVLWQGESRVERVEISAEQLDTLMRLALERATGRPREALEEPARQPAARVEPELRPALRRRA